MTFIFFGEDGLLRSGWRAVIFLMLFILTAGILGLIAQGIVASIGPERVGMGGRFVINSVLSLIPALVIGWLCGKYFEHLPYRALGASFEGKWVRNLSLGSALGILTFAFAVGLAYTLGGLRFELNTGDGGSIALGIAGALAIFAVGAAFEEALFRGYILQTLDRSGFAWLAILLTSIFFGLVHTGNPNASFFSTANTVLAGLWFSVAYLKTRDLWFVTGLHMMWNWTQGSIFGIEVSGLTNISGSSLLTEIDSGPTWLTGQTYGIEGGIACTVALVVSTITIIALPNIKADRDLRDLDLK